MEVSAPPVVTQPTAPEGEYRDAVLEVVVDGGLSVVAPPFFADATAPLRLPPRPARTE